MRIRTMSGFSLHRRRAEDMYFGFGLPLNEPYDTISKDVTSPPAAAS